MRSREWFHETKLLPGAWPIIRVDGRGFTGYTERAGFLKPFDCQFRDYMVTTAEALLKDWMGLYCYVESDEISVLLPRDSMQFGRSLEKLVSCAAGLASGVFSREASEAVSFDARVWLGTSEEDVVDYFRWRLADSERNCLNDWAYWTLRRAGYSAAKASKTLLHAKPAAKQAQLVHHGVNFATLPAWQPRGVGLYWEEYTKEGKDPRNGHLTRTMRRRVKRDMALPGGDGYSTFIRSLL